LKHKDAKEKNIISLLDNNNLLNFDLDSGITQLLKP